MMRYKSAVRHKRWFWNQHDKEDYECPLCGSDGPFDVHHRDGNPGNGAISNLVALCEPCHKQLHRDREIERGHYVDGWKKGFRQELMNG